MSVLAASLRREWGRLRASPWDWAMVSWVPLLVLALMCWIFSAGQPYRLPIAVWSEDSSALSRQLVRMLQATPGLEVRQTVLNRGEAADALLRMEVYGVVHIPPDLETHVKQGRGGAVTLLHNAQLATASSLLQRDLKQVVGTLSAAVEMQASAKRGTPHQVLQVQMEPIKTQLVALFNVSTNYEQFLAAALIPALIHILAMTAGAWSVGRELRDRTLGDWLSPDRQPAGTRIGGGRAAWKAAAACGAAVGQRHGSVAVSGAAERLERCWQHGLDCGGPCRTGCGEPGVWRGVGGHHLVVAYGAFGAGLLSAPAFAFSGMGFPCWR
jgi:ABC-2 type transport system permease protein